MIVGLTLIAVAIATFAFLHASKNGSMASYVWGLLGYEPADQKETAVDDKQELKNESAEKTSLSSGIITREKSPETATPQVEDGEATPKALPKANGSLPTVPSFSLQAHEDDEDKSDDEDNLPPPSFPAINSAQRASAMPPPKIPSLKPLSNGAPTMNGLMAPPPRPVGSRPAPPRPGAAGLRVPTTGPLPNRNPTANTLATPITTATQTPNPRKKVLLQPGHSPLDWAHLKRSGQNLCGVDRLIRVTPSMLKQRNGRKGNVAWSAYQGKVYNITPYLPFHPGGEGELRRVAGKDGARLFHEVHPWVNWESMLEGCLVGIMVSEGDGEKEKAELTSSLDDMD